MGLTAPQGPKRPRRALSPRALPRRQAKARNAAAESALGRELCAILDAVPSAMIVVDDAGTIQWFNAAAGRLFGLAPGDAISRDLRTLILPDFDPAASGPHLQTARCADGSTLLVEAVLRNVPVPDRRLCAIFLHDRRDTGRREDNSPELAARLAHAEHRGAMQAFGEALGHDLSQPLGAAANFLGAARYLLRRKADAERLAEAVDCAEAQLHAASALVRELRSAVAPDEPEPEPLAVEEILHEAARLVVPGPEPRLEFDVGEGVGLMLADPVLIRQLIVNLVRNAVESLRASGTRAGTVRLSARIRGRMVEIDVACIGPGKPAVGEQPPETHPAHGPPALDAVGLTICRHIAEAHGSTLDVADGPGTGATFRFKVPLFK